MIVGKLTVLGIFIIALIISVEILPQAQVEANNVAAIGTWEIVTSPTNSRLLGIDTVSEENIYAVGGAYFNNQNPIVLHYDGSNWNIDSTFSSTNQHLTAVSFSDTNNGWAVGYQTLSQYHSNNWSHATKNMSFLYGNEMLTENYGIAVGFYYVFSGSLNQYGSIQVYNGDTWQETNNRPEETYLDIDMLNADEGWIVGNGNGTTVFSGDAPPGIILHRPNAGSSWTPVHTTSEVLYSVTAVAADNVWAVGDNGLIVHFNGTSWQTIASPVTTDLKEIVMTSATEGWIVGASGTILAYTNGAWQQYPSPVTTDLHDIDILANGEAWTVGEEGVILHYQPPTTLTINYDSGAPSSFFTLVGSGFPQNDTATITLNNTTLGTVPTDVNGSFTFLLNSTGADEGAYIVTASVNPSATAWFILDSAAPVRPQEGTGTTFDIPAGIAFEEFIYLPVIIK